MEIVSVYLHTIPQPTLLALAQRYNIAASTL